MIEEKLENDLLLLKENDYKEYVKLLLKVELNIYNPDILEELYEEYIKDAEVKFLFNNKFYSDYIMNITSD